MIYEICPNTRQARDLYLKRAEQLMNSGVDGLFLDNTAAARKCWGPQFGTHEHIHDGDPNARAEGHLGFCYPKAARKYRMEIPIADEEQTYATAMLLKEIRELVQSYGTDKRIMTNGGDGSGFPPAFYAQCDSVMNEMFIFATYLDYNYLAPTHMDYSDHSPLDWLNVLAYQERFRPLNCRMNCLSDFSENDPARRRHALFALLCVEALGRAAPTPRRTRHSTPTCANTAWARRWARNPAPGARVMYREYEGGLVAINPYGVAQQATVPWTNKPSAVTMVGEASGVSHGQFSVKDNTLTFKLMPDRAAMFVPAVGVIRRLHWSFFLGHPHPLPSPRGEGRKILFSITAPPLLGERGGGGEGGRGRKTAIS